MEHGPQNPCFAPHKASKVKQAIQSSRVILLITLGVNLIFCPVITSFLLIKTSTSQRYSFCASVPTISKENDFNIKIKKNIDIKQGLITKLRTFHLLSICENTQFIKPFPTT
jgi:hypothetical protein